MHPDCSPSIATESPSAQSLGFAAAGSPSVLAQGDSFFTVTDPNGYCPMESCSLLDSSCSGVYSGDKLTIEGSSPWSVSAIVTVGAGYSETVCVKCSIGQVEFTSNSFVVTQTMDCSTSLSANSGYTPADASYDVLVSFNDQSTPTT